MGSLVTELLIEHFRTPMALIHLNQLLYICQRVGLAIMICTAIGMALAGKLAAARERQERVRPAEAFEDIGMQMSLHSIIHITSKFLL